MAKHRNRNSILLQIYKMNSLRTSSLFHYPQSISNLKHIIAEGFKPNYCRESFSIGDDGEYIVGIPMVSFCDIPLTRITAFKTRYKDYAIGLSQEWALRNGLNPVLYVTENSSIYTTLRIISQMKKQKNEELLELLEKEGVDIPVLGGTVKGLGYDIGDQNFFENIKLMLDDVNVSHTHITLFGHIKAFTTQKDNVPQCNYEENEWRYLIRENGILDIEWLWGNEHYLKWRGKHLKKPQSKFKPLTFDCNDVNFIIVSSDSEISDMIKYLKRLKGFGGGEKLSATQKDILISKIISMQRIEKDF